MTGFDLGQEADDEDINQTATETESEASTERETESEDQQENDPRETPAFPFSDNLRESFYVREETMEAFEDAKDLDATRLLREHGVRKVPTREVHDAAVRLAADNPEKLAEYILDERGIDADESWNSESP